MSGIGEFRDITHMTFEMNKGVFRVKKKQLLIIFFKDTFNI